MKNLLFAFFIVCGLLTNLKAQEIVVNSNSSDNLLVNQNDLIAALKIAGIQIFKFNTGEFDKKQTFIIQLEEFSNDSLISQRVLYTGRNWHTLYDIDNQGIDEFINLLSIITKENQNSCQLSINIHGTTINREFEFTKTYSRQFFLWKKYSETQWKLNEKTPVLAFVSSWKDNRGFIRLCGVSELKNGDEETKKLFINSPNYFILSYIVKGNDELY